MANDENLQTPAAIENRFKAGEKQVEIARLGGIKSGEAKRRKKLMSEIYADFLAKEHNILAKDGTQEQISGEKLLSKVMSKVLSRGDSSSVSLMREIREATEGAKLMLGGIEDSPPININVIGVDATENAES